jgi:hexosaminidase
MLDEARSFYGADYVKRTLDRMAALKLNVLHWHLTDDQGWRMEIKRYPRLTDIGAWRGSGKDRYGGFYTQDELRGIVAYARDLGIEIVPEIDMPGHALAALAAYPEYSCTGGPFAVSQKWGVHADVLCPGNDGALGFVRGILDEVMDVFPSVNIHVGGDECPVTRWKSCPKCQARVRAEGLRGVEGLRPWFMARVADYLRSRGRAAVAWDEILDGGASPGTIVQNWREPELGKAAASSGFDFIGSANEWTYLCWPLSRVALEKAYAYDPAPASWTPALRVRCLGIESAFWSEGAERESTAEALIWPRLAALAERAWSPAERSDFKDFYARLTIAGPELRSAAAAPGRR